ncbi:DUF2968 domain-containing protein [Caballeronia sp. dw_276]|jgi:hypothetical protein|uniref:DUF2968 domain-containing protein n=1 Tax=Caballeronia sp. dw_276 TaxID=2719795 RepID=UPI001BD2EB23|nr:DUF2968 domain-containing protein [Caballeronia sp. dw_276]
MNSNKTTRGGALVLAWFILCGAAFAAGPAAIAQGSATSGDPLGGSGARRSLLTNGAADEPQATANGNIAELQQMIRDGKVKELRTTYNGSYGASMLFYPDEMTFYIALFQQKKFWRVIKTQADARAETVYADFAKNSAALADTEIRRTKLEAEKNFADRLIAVQQQRANRLQADLEVARAQQSQVVDRQAEQQEAIRSLRAEQDSAQAQLRALQTKVQDLQRQSDTDLMPLPFPK